MKSEQTVNQQGRRCVWGWGGVLRVGPRLLAESSQWPCPRGPDEQQGGEADGREAGWLAGIWEGIQSVMLLYEFM